MLINEFLEHLQSITGQPRHLPHSPTVHVAVNNATYNRRPSAAIIEVEGVPPLALLVGNLQADYGGRTLILGRQVWRAGDRSRSKRLLSDLVDNFLEDLDVDLDAPLSGPLCYVGKGT